MVSRGLHSGTYWGHPERQSEECLRGRSIEHASLAPVFGTACPLKGLSGAIRRLACTRYSEEQSTQWLLLALSDRVCAREHHPTSFLTLRPDDPVTETGAPSASSGVERCTGAPM